MPGRSDHEGLTRRVELFVETPSPLVEQMNYSEGPMSGEGWDFVEERELRKSRSSRVCMNCEHFPYVADGDQHTLLTCRHKQRLVPHGDQLTRRCREWMVRREIEVGWCPEVA